MSGPKVVHIVTREEVIATCQVHMAQHDAALQHWLEKGRELNLFSDEEVERTLLRQQEIGALLEQDKFLDLQKQAPREIVFLEEQLKQKIADETTRQIDQRAVKRRLASTASTLLDSFEQSGISVSQEIRQGLVKAREGQLSQDETERVLAKAFDILTPQETGSELSERQKQLVSKLGQGEKTQSLSDWLSGQPSIDESSAQKLDKHIVRLQALFGAQAAAPYQLRADAIVAEPSPNQRLLLSDSLLIDLAQGMRQLSAQSVRIKQISVLATELEQLAKDGNADLLSLVAAARDDTAQSSDELVEQLQVAVKEARGDLATKARRKAVLGALSQLGYEVREGMQTAWVENGTLALHNAARPDHGVKLTGGVNSGHLQIRPVVFAPDKNSHDNSADRDAETLWCSDFSRLKELVATQGHDMTIEIATPVGKVAVEIVETGEEKSRTRREVATPLTRKTDR